MTVVSDAALANQICDAVFSIEDKAVVNESAVADNIDAVKEAADACPVAAIEIE